MVDRVGQSDLFSSTFPVCCFIISSCLRYLFYKLGVTIAVRTHCLRSVNSAFTAAAAKQGTVQPHSHHSTHAEARILGCGVFTMLPGNRVKE